MNRTVLPPRRPSETMALEHHGIPFFVTIGYDPKTAAVAEVFGSTTKPGSDFANVLSDACVLISLCLQHGVPPEQLGSSLTKVPAPYGHGPSHTSGVNDQPGTIVGVIVELLVERRSMVNAALA